jgi:hypothetical protein
MVDLFSVSLVFIKEQEDAGVEWNKHCNEYRLIR